MPDPMPRSLALSEFRPAQSDPLERERYNSYETDSTNTSRKTKSGDNHDTAPLAEGAHSGIGLSAPGLLWASC